MSTLSMPAENEHVFDFKLLNRNDNHLVQGILNSYLSRPGKNIRPLLIRHFGKIFRIEESEIQLLCRAAELIHTASLIHDDVVDEASKRRGQTTLNVTQTNARAVLAGDYLLARVVGELVQAGQLAPLKGLSETLEDLVEGEFLQDDLKSRPNTTREDLMRVSSKKTGSLLGWCCSSVLLLKGVDQSIVQKAQSAGVLLGVIFQMVDDNLDYSLHSGKEYGKDLKEGLINFTTLNLITLYPELYYPVYSIKGKDFGEGPWSKEQIDAAISMTNQVASDKVTEVNQLLKELFTENSKILDLEATKELFEFIDLLQKRIR